MEVGIKKEFIKNITVAEHMLENYKKELERIDPNTFETIRKPRKAKLDMYRKIIDEELKYIEDNYMECYSLGERMD